MANGFCDNCNMCRHWNGCGCTYVLGERECSYFLREIDRKNEIIYGENKPKINTIGSYSPTEQNHFHGKGYDSFDEFIEDMCNPDNSYNCNECPERESGNGEGLPCGQQNCWVDVHCK